MRVTLLRAGLIGSLFTLAACGGGAEKPAATTTTTAAMKPTATTAPAAQEEEYELDVIAEAEPDEGAPPLSVQLKADISGGQGERKIKWDFGDGSPPSSEVNPTHTYDKAGTFRASVEVADSTGDSDSDYVDIEVGSE